MEEKQKKKKNKLGHFIVFMMFLIGVVLGIGFIFSMILFAEEKITIISSLGFIGTLFALGFFGYCTIGYLNRFIEDFGEEK